MNNNVVIAITRQYGSGGRLIGESVAKKLGWEFYDRDLITMAAKKVGVDEKALGNIDEKASNSLLYTLAMGSSIYHNSIGVNYDVPINDKLFVIQSDIIHECSEKSSCVIVGRCADYVLRDLPNLVSVFIYADFDVRAKNIAERHELPLSQAKDLVIKTDKRRNNYYNYYTGRKWGHIENYDIAINTTDFSTDDAAELLKQYVLLKHRPIR